jgi:hypothetical protein
VPDADEGERDGAEEHQRPELPAQERERIATTPDDHAITPAASFT